MRLSQLLGTRFKEQPSDAFMQSHSFLLRGGYIRQVGGGIFSLLPPAKRVAQKIEAIIRAEMDAIGGQEVLFPVVLPAELWKESGRFDSVGSELMRMKDRAGRDLVLGMTHEEAAVHLARGEAQSYADYPFMIYQIQTKFRDEPRSRAGLIRVREFTMKDAYSFHTTQEDLEGYYREVYAAYEAIYRKAGLGSVLAVGSDTGMMGGSVAHEFMFLSEHGEDTLVICPHCGYSANSEVATGVPVRTPVAEASLELIHTPDITDMQGLADFFQVPESALLKSTVFEKVGSDKPLIVFLRGDYQVNEAKLRRLVGAEVQPYVGSVDDGLTLGFVGPYDLDMSKFEVYFDRTLEGETNLICGANRVDQHYKGLNLIRDVEVTGFVDIAKANAGDGCPQCGNPLTVQNGIEVGNIFQLGTKYTESMNMAFTDRDGQLHHPIMGCYGIGVGRLLSCVIEEHCDDKGPIWPIQVAPWQVHICVLSAGDESIRQVGEDLYSQLSARYETLVDDRDVSAGIQFADADLLGIPVRVVASKRGLSEGLVEISLRDKSQTLKVPKEEAVATVEKLVAELLAQA